MFECHFFNDFSGYGALEVMENAFEEAYDQFKRKDFDVRKFWTHIEAIGYLLHTSTLMGGFMSEFCSWLSWLLLTGHSD